MDMNKKTQFNIWYWIIAFFILMAFQYFFATAYQVARIPYSQFETDLKDGKIAEIAVSDNFIQGRYKEPQNERPFFLTTRVDPDLAQQFLQHGVVVTGQVESTFLRDLLSWLIPVALFAGVWMFMIRRMGGGLGGGLMQIGKSKAKVYVQTDTGVTFQDAAGVDEAKDELKEIVDFLKGPSEYGRLGGRMPKGVLLVGPPGTGKTLLARAVAGEAGVPFFSISGSEFVEMFVGVGAARVRDLFEQARARAPAIIFIDELDALGRARGIGPMAGGHDEKEQTLNQLLVELDGFDPSTGLVLLAATNRPEILDPALLRAGRFDRQVLVDRPDKGGRIQILSVHLKKAKLSPDVSPEKIAALTPGFTGADLANLVNEAALLATRRRGGGHDGRLQRRHRAHRRGSRKAQSAAQSTGARNRRLPRDGTCAGRHGFARSRPGPQGVHHSARSGRTGLHDPAAHRRPLPDDAGGIGEQDGRAARGRAAEKIVFGHLSTGAADDLIKVTDIARAMVTRYGMTEKLGHVALEKDRRSFLATGQPMYGQQEVEFSNETAATVDEEVRRIVNDTFERTLALLSERKELLIRSAEVLLQNETLDEGDLASLMEGAIVAEGLRRPG